MKVSDRGEVLRRDAVLEHQREVITVLSKDRGKGAERGDCPCRVRVSGCLPERLEQRGQKGRAGVRR
jgi:hypothetical protein